MRAPLLSGAGLTNVACWHGLIYARTTRPVSAQSWSNEHVGPARWLRTKRCAVSAARLLTANLLPRRRDTPDRHEVGAQLRACGGMEGSMRVRPGSMMISSPRWPQAVVVLRHQRRSGCTLAVVCKTAGAVKPSARACPVGGPRPPDPATRGRWASCCWWRPRAAGPPSGRPRCSPSPPSGPSS